MSVNALGAYVCVFICMSMCVCCVVYSHYVLDVRCFVIRLFKDTLERVMVDMKFIFKHIAIQQNNTCLFDVWR